MENPANLENQEPKRKWLPQTKEGKRALIFGIIVTVLGLLLILSLFEFFRLLFTYPYALLNTNTAFFLLLAELVLFILGLYYSIRTIYKIKERNILNIISFVLICIIGGFWLLWTLGSMIL